MRLKRQKLNRAPGLRARIERGFTFMELLIVMVIIGILAAVAIPKVIIHLRKAKEVVLQEDLWAMRRAIDSFWQDKEKPPANLEDLVSSGYLREIPKDPVCADCQWNVISAPADDVSSAGGIGDVKSSAPGEDLNGKSYADY
ncbi:MAG: prepilin-type N-terminal cleavage/methylation domain-containing protein [Chloracidobacterium sp.]|nr:prepilin-type N-terminal cleavage/methylation domain-containing protein [Chloracidobacterium sp.]